MLGLIRPACAAPAMARCVSQFFVPKTADGTRIMRLGHSGRRDMLLQQPAGFFHGAFCNMRTAFAMDSDSVAKEQVLLGVLTTKERVDKRAVYRSKTRRLLRQAFFAAAARSNLACRGCVYELSASKNLVGVPAPELEADVHRLLRASHSVLTREAARRDRLRGKWSRLSTAMLMEPERIIAEFPEGQAPRLALKGRRLLAEARRRRLRHERLQTPEPTLEA